MAGASDIEWTDATWNPLRGCTKISPGCKHCYAETFAERFRGVPGHPYEQGFDLRLVPEALEIPLRWKTPKRIFANSMSDPFHKDVPKEFIFRMWDVMVRAKHHTFQVLTKRSERLAELAPRLPWPSNVWMGVSVESDKYVARVLDLLKVEAAVRFLSVEPLLDETHLAPYLRDLVGAIGVQTPQLRGLQWVIVGGESGISARPCDAAWIRQVVRDGKACKVPVFVKQLGARFHDEIHGVIGRLGKAPGDVTVRRLAHTKGGDMDEWPEDLRVRQWPEVARAD